MLYYIRLYVGSYDQYTKIIYKVMEEKDFNKLLRHIASDKKAFQVLYKFYYPRIINHINRMYPNVDAEEIAHEFFIKLLSAKKFNYVKNPTSWVYVICRNIVKYKYGKNNYISFDESNKISDTLIQEADFDSHIDLEAQTRQMLSLADDLTRKIIFLYYWEGYNFNEVSELLSMKAVTVRQKHARFVKKVKRTFKHVTKQPKNNLLLVEDEKWKKD